MFVTYKMQQQKWKVECWDLLCNTRQPSLGGSHGVITLPNPETPVLPSVTMIILKSPHLFMKGES